MTTENSCEIMAEKINLDITGLVACGRIRPGKQSQTMTRESSLFKQSKLSSTVRLNEDETKNFFYIDSNLAIAKKSHFNQRY